LKKLLTALLVVAMVLSLASVAFAADFSDTADLSKDAKESIAKLNALDIINGYPDGTFKPANNITRAEFAKIACIAGGMGKSAEMLQSSTSRFNDVAAGQWYTGYINLATSQNWVKGYPDGTFRPNNQITYAEVITVLVRLLGYNDNLPGPWPVDYIAKAGAIDITEDVSFDANAPATRGDVAIMAGATLDCTVVSWNSDNEEFVKKLDKNNEEVSLLEDKMNLAKIEGIVTDIPRITSSLKDDQIRINSKLYDVVEGAVDVEAIFGVDVDAWLNDDDEVIYVDYDEDTVLYDALEDVVEDELTLVDADDDYDIDEDVVFYVNGNKLKAAQIAALNNATYDYAKVVLNDDGDVIFVDAYNWDDYIVVEEVKGEEIFGYGDELDTEDFTIVKDGATIDVADIVAGDIVFFKASAELAEVFTKSVEGEIEEIFVGKFEVAGKSFDYTNNSYGVKAVQYINEDGDIDNFNKDVAEQMEEEGAVTVFLNRAGDAVFVAGDLGVVEKSTFGALLYEDMVGYKDTRGNDYLELKVVNEEGKAVTYDFRLDDIEVLYFNDSEVWDEDAAFDLALIDTTAGTPFSATGIDFDNNGTQDIVLATSAAQGDVVEITVDEDGDVVELGFFDTQIAIAPAAESGDKYIEDKRMSDSVPVFIIDATAAELLAGTWDDEDVEVITYGEFDEDVDLNSGEVFHDGSKALYLVITSTDMQKTTTKKAVLTQVRENSDGIARIKALVDGEVVTYYAEDEINPDSDPTTPGLQQWAAGMAAELEVIDANGNVKAMTLLDGVSFTVGAGYNVVTRDREITSDGTAANTWELVDSGYIYDVADPSDIESMTFSELRDVKAGTNISVIYDSSNPTKYVKFILVGAQPGSGPVGNWTMTLTDEVDAPAAGIKVDLTKPAAENFADYVVAAYDGDTLVKAKAAGATVNFGTGDGITNGKIYTIKVLKADDLSEVVSKDIANIL